MEEEVVNMKIQVTTTKIPREERDRSNPDFLAFGKVTLRRVDKPKYKKILATSASATLVGQAITSMNDKVKDEKYKKVIQWGSLAKENRYY